MTPSIDEVKRLLMRGMFDVEGASVEIDTRLIRVVVVLYGAANHVVALTFRLDDIQSVEDAS